MGKQLKKFYAVKKGLKPGIYKSWPECHAQVNKYKGAIYKSFITLKEAEEFMKAQDKEESSNTNIFNPTYAYIDGSFNKRTKVYGYGGFLMHNNNKYIIQGSGNDPNLSKMRNVSGEIISCQEVIKKAIELGVKDIDIFYDYSGIEKWATGKWKRNKPGTEKYFEYMQSIKSEINVYFKKVKGHSGNEGNDEADKLAKQAAGIQDNDDEIFYYDEQKDEENEKDSDNKNNISLSDIKHIKKNLLRKNEINKNENKSQILKKKLLNEKIKNIANEEKK